MSLFDQLASQVLGSGAASTTGAGSQQGALMSTVTNLIAANGGVSGLLQKFKDSGMQDHVASWIGTGANHSISGEDINNALGQESVQKAAQEAGLPPEQAAGGLAKLLPEIINQLSPNGALPQGALLEQGLNLLKGKLFG